MDELAFEKVSAGVYRPGAEQLPLGKGRLIVRAAGLDFQNEKGNLSMRPVRSLDVTKSGVKVEFGEGRDLRTAFLFDLSKGIFRARSQTRLMGDAIRQRLEMKGLTEEETVGRERVETAEARAGMQKAKVQMWVWGVVAFAGTVATIATISAASDGGGTYYVFWGAILFGIGGVLEAYFDRYRKYRRVLDRVGGGGEGATSRARGRTTAEPPGEPPDLGRLEKDRDVDGLVSALWRDELDIRVKVMAALSRLKDPRTVDLLLAALQDERWDRRWSAAETLGKLDDRRAVEPLRAVLMDENALVVAVAEDSIKSLEKGSV